MTKKDAGPEYMKAEDLIKNGEWREYTLTIAEVIPPNTRRAADETLIEHPIIIFKGAKKHFICGRTNRRLVVYACGGDESTWPGHKITLRACMGNWGNAKTHFDHENVTALRVVPPAGDQARPSIKKTHYGTPLTGKSVGLGVVETETTNE